MGTVRTALYDDSNNSYKFYRVWTLGTYGITQYGSAKQGMVGGNYSVTKYATANAALAATDKVLDSKLAKGYLEQGSRLQVSFDLLRFEQELGNGGDRAAGAWLDRQLASINARTTVNAIKTPPGATTRKDGTTTPDPTPQVGPDPLLSEAATVTVERLAERTLQALSLAATDPVQALTMSSRLHAMHDEVDAAMRKFTSYLETLDELLEEHI